MAQSVSGFFAGYAELVRSRNLRALAELHRFPFMIEADDETTVAMGSEDLVKFLSERLARLEAAGVTDLAARVAAVELPRAGRVRAWVRWTHHFEDRVEHDAVGMIYYLVRSPGGLLAVEMLSYVSMAPIEAQARVSAEIA